MKDEPIGTGNSSDWPGVSSLSWMWAHVADGARFEVRRAVSSMTHGLRLSSEASYGLTDPDARELLAVIVAADSIEKAAKETLQEVVNEARTRKVSWEQIGGVLGYKEKTKKSGAHKRFKKGVDNTSPIQEEIAPVEKAVASVTFRSVTDTLPSGTRLPLDEEDWEAAPAETAVPYAMRNMAGASISLAHAFEEPLSNMLAGEDEEVDSDFVRSVKKSYEVLRHSAAILMSTQTWKAIDSAARELSATSRVLNEGPVPHFVHATCLSLAALTHLHNFLEPGRKSSRTRARSLVLANQYLESAVFATVRPECLKLLDILESKAQQAGHAIYESPASRAQNIDWVAFSEAYWRRDTVRLAEVAETDPSETWKSREIMDVIRLVESMVEDDSRDAL